jgi:hypothetical protein
MNLSKTKLHLLSLVLLFCVANVACAQGAVQTYQKDVQLTIQKDGKPFQVTQHRWYLENDFVRLAVTDDPGGSVVEFTDKKTGTNHVAGDVYSYVENGKPVKFVYYGWNDTIDDNTTDPIEKKMNWQPYKVETQDGENGAKIIKVTGQTAEQKVERWHTLRPDSGEVLIHIRLTNISSKPRRLYLRWHPFMYASADKFGDTGTVLAPEAGSEVGKIRLGWGYDNWFRTYDGYWMAADYKSGEGIFSTFEKEKVPVRLTWTNAGGRGPLKGSVTLETIPEVVIKAPGESVETSFTYCPFSRETAPDAIPLGVVTDKDEQERARQFLRNAKPVEHMAMLNRYTFTLTDLFPWYHHRRDLLGLRDWGFADCAILGYPLPNVPTKVRMVGGVFDDAANLKGFPANAQLVFRITVVDENGRAIYDDAQAFPLRSGVPGDNYFDREIAIPMSGIPDGQYTFRVEALDPMTGKAFHHHEMKTVVFAQKMQREKDVLSKLPVQGTPPRPFVTALAAQNEVKIENGRATVPIGVEDGSDTQRNNFPVRFGVPFPQGAFQPDAPVRLLSPRGETVPAQFFTMSVWPDHSLKWLGVDFQASCPANGFDFYHLEIGKGVPVVKAQSNIARETPEYIELNTGPMLIRVPRKTLSVPGEVFVDANHDGQFSDDEKVLLASQPGDAWWQDKDRNFAMQLSGEKNGDIVPGVEIESNGPQSAVVKITGWYQNGDAKPVALGEARVEVFRGKPFFKLWHQVTFTGNAWHDRLTSYGLTLHVPPHQFTSATYEMDGKALPLTGASSLFQKSANSLEVRQEQKLVASGHRSDGAIALSGPRGQVLLYHRDLWQLFPKKLSANLDAGELRVDYWPKEAGEFSFEPNEEFWIPSSSSPEAVGTGTGRTQEMTIDFSGLVKVEDAAKVYGEPVIACTPPAWVYKTGVLQNLHPYDPKRYPEVEKWLSSVTDFYNRQRDFFGWYGHWDYGTLHNIYATDLYKWLIVGRYANIGNEEDIVEAPWLMYFRTGDRKYYDFARLWTRHLMEVQSIRWIDTYPEYIGMSRRHQVAPWQGSGDKGHTMLDPYVEYYHADGYAPAWDAAKRAAAAMANTYEGAWRYIDNPLQGNIRMYVETGDPKYKAVADRIWRDLMAPDRNEWFTTDHGSRMTTWYAPYNEETMKLWKEWAINGREVNGKRVMEFPYLDTYGALGDMTGNDRFAHLSRLGFDRFRGDSTGQLFGDNPVYRGMAPIITQHVINIQRSLPYAAAQIARSKELFPAEYYNGRGLKEIVIKEDTDADFTIWISAAKAEDIKVNGPDGKPVQLKVEVIYSSKAVNPDWTALELLKITVPKDGQTGFYRVPLDYIGYFGCSLKQVALRADNTLNFSAGAPLYVRPQDIGGTAAHIIMRSTPGNSLEVSTLDGKRVFSQTYMRPPEDTVGIEYRFDLPQEKVLRLDDKVGITFPDVKEIPLYLNPDGIFDLS